jgi:hypothetical protein
VFYRLLQAADKTGSIEGLIPRSPCFVGCLGKHPNAVSNTVKLLRYDAQLLANPLFLAVECGWHFVKLTGAPFGLSKRLEQLADAILITHSLAADRAGRALSVELREPLRYLEAIPLHVKLSAEFSGCGAEALHLDQPPPQLGKFNCAGRLLLLEANEFVDRQLQASRAAMHQ